MSAKNDVLQRSIFWGELVQVAYDMYEQDHMNPKQSNDFPADWEMIAYLYIDPRFGFFERKEFVGFLAYEKRNPKHYAVIFRGTESVLDWISDLEFSLCHFDDIEDGGKTELGFTRLYHSATVQYLNSDWPEESFESMFSRIGTDASFTVAGHSLGGALATLFTTVAADKGYSVASYTFASPRVGNHAFVHRYQSLPIQTYRIFNHPDIVPKVPVALAGYEHVDQGIEINSLDFPLKHSILTYHALKTYLYVLGSNKYAAERPSASEETS